MNRLRALLVLTLLVPAPRTVRAQTNSLSAGVSAPVGDFSSAAFTGFGLALLSETGITIGPIDVRVDVTFDRFGGKLAGTRYQYQGFGLSFVNEASSGLYWLAGASFSNASDQVTLNGRAGTRTHNHGGLKAGVGVNFGMFNRAVFIEGNLVKLLATSPAPAWVPIRFGFRF